MITVALDIMISVFSLLLNMKWKPMPMTTSVTQLICGHTYDQQWHLNISEVRFHEACNLMLNTEPNVLICTCFTSEYNGRSVPYSHKDTKHAGEGKVSMRNPGTKSDGKKPHNPEVVKSSRYEIQSSEVWGAIGLIHLLTTVLSSYSITDNFRENGYVKLLLTVAGHYNCWRPIGGKLVNVALSFIFRPQKSSQILFSSLNCKIIGLSDIASLNIC